MSAFKESDGMARNILIFSDGTGQVGGYSFDEDRTNVYKLYRATRVAPDSCIDPKEQVAFYDPGLGSRGEGGFLFIRTVRWIYKKVSQATGLGLTGNIIKCYAAIIRLAKPEDRIFLFGFSRGAYTVRCIASLISLCGIPTQNIDGGDLPLDEAGSWKLAKYAVKHVYQFTPARKESKATPYQKFLLRTRDRLAVRFRMDCRSFDPNHPIHPNTYPYFVGVFDTVAALGSVWLFVKFTVLYAIGAASMSWLIALVPGMPIIGSYLKLLKFWPMFWIIVGVPIGLATCIYILNHVKFDFGVPGYSPLEQLRTFHFLTEWKEKFYDTDLELNISYAKHAISIDENRRDFVRVPWGNPDDRQARDDSDNLTFEQVWFSGNHADVGGGYPENESRLSDTALKWMLACAYTIPNGIKYDRSVLRLHTDSAGLRHDEVKSGFGAVTNFFGWTWRIGIRKLPTMENSDFSDAPMHRSVYERFDTDKVLDCDSMKLYRPPTLANHLDFKDAYENPTIKSNPQRARAAAYIETQLPPNL
jgi:uncharacterized protein (DUF2235 family)